jgi:60 kDa SS-A/Ro ribonucleoprotein
MNRTFYATADEQMKTVLALAQTVEPAFVAKTAIHARESGYMKDMPALLCAVLASRDRELLKATFPRVMDNARMVRNFVQIIRSGVTGRKSLGTLPKRLVRDWIAARSIHDARTAVKIRVFNLAFLPDLIYGSRS